MCISGCPKAGFSFAVLSFIIKVMKIHMPQHGIQFPTFRASPLL